MVKSKYKYVYGEQPNGRKDIYWRAKLKGAYATFKTEREAAIAVDKMLINRGLEPVNILVRKK